MASKRYSIVDKSVCVACGACENICPLGAIKVHKGCFAKVAQDKCVDLLNRTPKQLRRENPQLLFI